MRVDPDIEALVGSPPPAVVKVGRGAQASVGGAYEGASRFDREVALWSPSTDSADGDIMPAKRMADARVSDLHRNDAIVAGGSAVKKDNIVGGQYVLNAKPETKLLLGTQDETWEADFQEEVEAKFSLWAESPECWVDASRGMTFTALIRAAVGCHAMHGEVLASVEWLRDVGRPSSTAIQLIDVARLETPPQWSFDRNVVGGIEHNRQGQPVAYHIRDAHPADYGNADSYRFSRVEARKPWGRPQILHLYEMMRPDQSRGISTMVTALKECRVTKRFRDVVLQNAVVNATFAASLESDLPSESVFAAIGAGDDPSGAIADYATGYLAAINGYSGHSKSLQMNGVRIPHLFPGTKLQLRPAGQAGPLGTEFEQSLLRYIASALGVSYEQLSKDYSQTNYSSARASINEAWKSMMAVKKLIPDRLATSIYRLWLEEQLNKGAIQSMPRAMRSDLSWLYLGQSLDAIAACEWIGAARGQIDELKETQAAIQRVKNGLSTWEAELASSGKDWRKVFHQMAREKALAERLGLDFMSAKDNATNATTGAAREPADA
jgi:lambda family phage portal protein